MNRNEIKGPCRTRVLTFTPSFGFNWLTESVDRIDRKSKERKEVPPRFELGLQDSESWVLTITPWDQRLKFFRWLFQKQLERSRYYSIHHHVHIHICTLEKNERKESKKNRSSPRETPDTWSPDCLPFVASIGIQTQWFHRILFFFVVSILIVGNVEWQEHAF